MRFLVIGAGLQGRACAFDLLRSPGVEEVLLADASPDCLNSAREFLASDRLQTAVADATDTDAVFRLASGVDVVASCVPYFLNLPLARVAIAARAHFLDLGGSTAIVREELALDEEARRAGVTIIPDCGLGPGMINTLAVHAMREFDEVDEVRILDGGLPQNRALPLGYMLVFSIHGLLQEYAGKGSAIRDFRRVEVDGLSEVEVVELPPPLGRCEVAHAAGGLSTMAWTFEGKVRSMVNKLIRYPGHIDFFNGLKAAGLLSEEAIEVDGVQVVPRALAARLLERHLDHPGEKDLVFIQVTVRGRRAGEPGETVCELLDSFDEGSGLTAMMRTTGFPASIVAQLLARRVIDRPGAFPVEIGVPTDAFLAEAAQRGFDFRWRRS